MGAVTEISELKLLYLLECCGGVLRNNLVMRFEKIYLRISYQIKDVLSVDDKARLIIFIKALPSYSLITMRHYPNIIKFPPLNEI